MAMFKLGISSEPFMLQLKLSCDRTGIIRRFQISSVDYTFYDLHCHLQTLLTVSSDHSNYFYSKHYDSYSGSCGNIFIGDVKSYNSISQDSEMKIHIFKLDTKYKVAKYFIERNKISYSNSMLSTHDLVIKLEEIKQLDLSVEYPINIESELEISCEALQLKLSCDRTDFEQCFEISSVDFTFYDLHCYLQTLLKVSSDNSNYFYRPDHKSYPDSYGNMFIGDLRSFNSIPRNLEMLLNTFKLDTEYKVADYFREDRDTITYSNKILNTHNLVVKFEERKQLDPLVEYPIIIEKQK